MSPRRRRAAVLVGLALLLGGLAASDVSQRERALDDRLRPLVSVVVAADDLAANRPLRREDLATRELPERYAPTSVAAVKAEDLVGRRVDRLVSAGTFMTDGLLAEEDSGPDVPNIRKGERAAYVVGAGSPDSVAPGTRVDVVVTRGGGENGGGGRSVLALEDLEVLAVAPAGSGSGAADDGTPRVALSLRVSVSQAVYLAAAQDFARRVRFLPRLPGDRRHRGRIGVGEGL